MAMAMQARRTSDEGRFSAGDERPRWPARRVEGVSITGRRERAAVLTWRGLVWRRRPVGRERGEGKGMRPRMRRGQRQLSDGSRCVCCFVSSCLVSCWAGAPLPLCRPCISARGIRCGCGCGCDLEMRGGEKRKIEKQVLRDAGWTRLSTDWARMRK